MKKKQETFLVSLYSLEPLPKEIRGTFKLPKWPFKDGERGPAPAETIDYLQKLSVVHYRDELNRYPLLVQLIGQTKSVREMHGFRAYFSMAMLNYKNMKIAQWSDKGNPENYGKLIEKHGDDFAWLRWNEDKIIAEMTGDIVRFA